MQACTHWVSNCVPMAVPLETMLSVDIEFFGQQSAFGLLSKLHSSRKLVRLCLPCWERSGALLWASFLSTLPPLCSFRCPSTLSMGWQCSVLPTLLRNLEPVLKACWALEKDHEKHHHRDSCPQESWSLYFTGASASFFFFSVFFKIGKFTLKITVFIWLVASS